MAVKMEVMKLPDLLEKYRVYTIRELCRRTGLTSQQGWHLWHHERGLTRDTIKLLHDRLGISYEELMEVDPAKKREPKGSGEKRAPKGSRGRRKGQRPPKPPGPEASPC